MSNLIDVYTQSGYFDAGLWFVHLYNSVYDLFEYEIPSDQKLDEKNIDFNAIKHLFKEVIRIRRYEESNIKEQSEVEIYLNDEEFDIKRENGKYLTIAADNKIIQIKTNGISIYHNGEKFEDLEKLAEKRK